MGLCILYFLPTLLFLRSSCSGLLANLERPQTWSRLRAFAPAVPPCLKCLSLRQSRDCFLLTPRQIGSSIFQSLSSILNHSTLLISFLEWPINIYLFPVSPIKLWVIKGKEIMTQDARFPVLIPSLAHRCSTHLWKEGRGWKPLKTLNSSAFPYYHYFLTSSWSIYLACLTGWQTSLLACLIPIPPFFFLHKSPT